MFTIGERVFIKPEFVDFVNPLLDEKDQMNYRTWIIKEALNSRFYNSFNNKDYTEIVYNLEQTNEWGTFRLKEVREFFIYSMSESREEKLEKILTEIEDSVQN
jgi:hypothetical protein